MRDTIGSTRPDPINAWAVSLPRLTARCLIMDGDAEYEGVLTNQALEIARGHPDIQGKLREILDSEQGAIYRYGGTIDLTMVLIVDSEAMVCSHGWGGSELQAVRSDDDAFRQWVDSYIDSLEADSEQLTPDSFAG